MNLRNPTVPAIMLCLLLALPAVRAAAQETPPPAARGAADSRADGAKEGLAACVRGRIITRHEVEKEAARLQELAPDTSWKMLMWYARARLAERMILAETAKRAAAKISDDAIRRDFTGRGMDLNDVIANFERLKEDLLIDLYFDARLGKIDWLEDVVPDMAFFVRVTPDEIRSYYHNNPEMFTIKGQTTLLRVLFPATVFLDPGLRRGAAAECASLLEDPAAVPPDEAGFLKIFRDRWPGCLPKAESVTAGEDKKFLPAVMDFIEKAAAGDVSGVIELEGGLVVVRILEKIAGRKIAFEEIQDEVAVDLREAKEQNARRIIVEELKKMEKVFWPPDLFEQAQPEESRSGQDTAP